LNEESLLRAAPLSPHVPAASALAIADWEWMNPETAGSGEETVPSFSSPCSPLFSVFSV